VFVSGALVLWDPSLRNLALFGILEIGVLIALTLSKKGGAVEEHGHGHAALPAHGHATANLGGHAPAGAHVTSTH
jgi:NADH-quinone oxidoreductase subunit H